MSSFKTIFILILLTKIQIGFGQAKIDLTKNLSWVDRYIIADKGLVQIAFDTITFDSIFIDKHKFERKNKDGIIIEKVFVSNSTIYCSNNKYNPNGYYHLYYENGELKLSGELTCGCKTNEWVEFYKNGTIKSLTNYSQLINIDTYQKGLYKEYHVNGIPKITGNYQLFEKLDTFKIFNFENYESKDTCCNWKIVSMKTRKWSEFDSLYNLVKEENLEIQLHADSIRKYENESKLIKE